MLTAARSCSEKPDPLGHALIILKTDWKNMCVFECCMRVNEKQQVESVVKIDYACNLLLIWYVLLFTICFF